MVPVLSRSILWVVTVCLVLGVAIVFAILRSGDMISASLLQHLEEKTGYDIEVDSVQVTFFPEVGLEVSGPRILDPSSAQAILTARRVEFILQALPLLRGEVVGKRLVVEQPHLQVRRDESGHWTIPTGRPVERTIARDDVGPLSLIALAPNLLVADGRITLTDDRRPGDGKTLPITSLHAVLSVGLPERAVKIQVFAEIFGDPVSTMLSVDGTLIQTRPLNGDDIVATPPVQFDGRVQLHGADLRQLADWSGLGPIKWESPALVNASGLVRLIPRRMGYDLIATELAIGAMELSLRGEARLLGLGLPVPEWSATFASSPFRLERGLAYVPTEGVFSRISTIITDHEVDGLVTIRTARITGKLGASPTVAMSGEADVRDGRIRLGEEQPALRGLSARLHYADDQIEVADLEAGYGAVRFSQGHAVVTELKKDPRVDLRVDASAPAAGLIGLVAKTYRSPQTEQLERYVRQATGDIRARAHVAGRLAPEALLENLAATITIENVGFHDPSMRLVVQKVNGQVRLGPKSLHVDSLSGYVGPAQLETRGLIKWVEDQSYQDLTIQLLAEAQEVTSWFGVTTAAASTEFRGQVQLVARVTGAVQTPRIKGHVQLERTAVAVSHMLNKPVGAPASIEFDGKLSRDLVLSFSRCDLLLPPIRIASRGQLRLLDDWLFNAKVVSRNVRLQQLPQGISLGPVKAGVVDAVLSLQGQGNDRKSWQASGHVHLDQGVVEPPRLRETIRDLALELRFDGQNIGLERVSLMVGRSDIRGSGMITNWTKAPRIALNLESSEFDLSLLRPAESGAGSVEEDTGFFRRFMEAADLQATVSIGYAYYERFLFQDVSCQVSLGYGALTVERLVGETDEGRVAGRVHVRWPERRLGQIESDLQVSGIPIERLLSLFKKEDTMTGWLSITGQMKAELAPEGPVTASLTSRRPVRVVLQDGRILNVPVISKLLSVLNLTAVLKGKVDLTEEGLPFDRIRSVLDVSNGVVTFTEFYLNSPVLKVSGTGRYDVAGDEFDMVLATSPLGSYSDLLKDVPLFGTLIAGEREGFDTAIFEVKGSAKDPDVTYLPAESFARGVKGTARLAIDILVNALTLPKHLMEGAP